MGRHIAIMKECLFVISTFNQVDYTKKCFESIVKIPNMFTDYDVVVYDDFSTDSTEALCKDYDIEFITTDKPRGLTYNWNRAYKRWQQGDYKYLYIVNNDIMIPKGALDYMNLQLRTYPFIVPVSSRKGVGHSKEQAIEGLCKNMPDAYAFDPDNYQRVQNKLANRNKGKAPKKLGNWSGFFFGFNKDIKKAEFQSGILFDPKRTMVHQESDLMRRVRNKDVNPRVCLQSFVYHFKGRSTSGVPGRNRDDLTRYHKEYYATKNK